MINYGLTFILGFVLGQVSGFVLVVFLKRIQLDEMSVSDSHPQKNNDEQGD